MEISLMAWILNSRYKFKFPQLKEVLELHLPEPG